MVFQLQIVMLRSKSGMISFCANESGGDASNRDQGQGDAADSSEVLFEETNEAEM